MTAVARLKTNVIGFDWDSMEAVRDDTPRMIYTNVEEQGLWFEAELCHPASLKGRKVIVVISPEQLQPVLAELRSAMIEIRSKPMEATT